MDNKSASQNTLDETFESITPLEPEEPPIIEQVETPPPLAIKSETNKIKNRLSALASPFKTSKNFHLGSIKRGKNSDKEDADSEKESKDAAKPTKKTKKIKPDETPMSDDNAAETGGEEDKGKEKKKKRGARSRAGALVKRLGSLGGRRGGEAAAVAAGVAGVAERRSSGSSSLTPTSVKRLTPDGEDGPVSEPSLNDESGSRYGSVENVIPSQDMPTPVDSAEDPPIITDTETIATTHPVSTLPFVVSTWKPKAKSEIEKPIESPSPEDALRRRIAFVAQATVCLSEDQEDLDEDKLLTEIEGSPATRLSRMVELARQQKRSESPGTRSRSPSPGPSGERLLASQEAEKTDDEEYEDTEESRLLPNISPQSHMPPFGDLIDGSDNPHLNMGSGSSSNPAPLGGDRREHLYKILVIGELGTGKTSIIKRYVHQFFSQHYRATIGVDFALKVLNWDPNTTIRLQLWDIAGQERFGNMTRVYYKEAVGAFIVFDVTRVATFEAVVKWKQDLDSKVQLPDGSPIPCILLANKCDQQKEGIVNTPTKMDEYCREKGFAGWYETSAKENINIEEAARSLVNKILLNDKLIQSIDSRDGDRFPIDGRNGTESAATSKSCAC